MNDKLIVAIVLLIVALSMGCIESDDEKCINCMLEQSEQMIVYAEAAQRQAYADDLAGLQKSGRRIQAHSADSLDEIDGFTVSLELEGTVREYREYLECMNMCGICMDLGFYETAIAHAEDATAHIERAGVEFEIYSARL